MAHPSGWDIKYTFSLYYWIDIDGPTPRHGTLGPSAHTIKPYKETKQDIYSGFGGALAYGYGFRIGSAPLGIVAVFGAQNSFCQFGVP
jgi:hypothetical protein